MCDSFKWEPALRNYYPVMSSVAQGVRVFTINITLVPRQSSSVYLDSIHTAVHMWYASLTTRLKPTAPSNQPVSRFLVSPALPNIPPSSLGS
ncbi:hypothetical protein ARMSODRAFT_967345, partial [Armillaria solidipes]